MAPKRSAPSNPPDPGPLPGPAAVRKRKRYCSVRRFENGLLNVERKSGKYFKICKQNTHSPLLRLPPEMRNQIWEFALGGSDFCIEHLKKNSIVRIKPTAPLINTPAVAILRTCRQIYAEAALYPYKSNEFRLVVPTNGTSLSRPLPQFGVSMIRDLHVDLLGWLSRGVMGALLMPTFTASLASRLPQLRRIVLDVSMTSSELCVAVNETPLSEQCATMTQGIKDLMIGGRKDFMVVFEARLLG